VTSGSPRAMAALKHGCRSSHFLSGGSSCFRLREPPATLDAFEP